MRQTYSNRLLSCSIVIRCFNEERNIGRLLHGIDQQTVKDLEIILVDSGSTDGTLTIASRFPVKIVCIRPEEFSFGRSLNLGCTNATKDFVVIASAHVYPMYRDWIEQLLRPFKDERIGLVYGQQRGGKTTKFSEQQIFEKWFPDRSNLNQSHPFCNNANAAIRKKLWEKFQYDENLTGLEDIDIANRIIKAGFKIAYQSKSVILHIHNEIPHQIYNRYRREAIALKTIFPNENFQFNDFLRLFVQNVLSDYRKAIDNGCTSRDFMDVPIFRLIQFWGTYQGFRETGPVTSQLKQTFYYPNRDKTNQYNKRSNQRNPMLIDYKTEERTFRENR